MSCSHERLTGYSSVTDGSIIFHHKYTKRYTFVVSQTGHEMSILASNGHPLSYTVERSIALK